MGETRAQAVYKVSPGVPTAAHGSTQREGEREKGRSTVGTGSGQEFSTTEKRQKSSDQKNTLRGHHMNFLKNETKVYCVRF